MARCRRDLGLWSRGLMIQIHKADFYASISFLYCGGRKLREALEYWLDVFCTRPTENQWCWCGSRIGVKGSADPNDVFTLAGIFLAARKSRLG